MSEIDLALPCLISTELYCFNLRYKLQKKHFCTINSQLNGNPKEVSFLISKLHSILAAANLLAHNIWLCYYVQIRNG